MATDYKSICKKHRKEFGISGPRIIRDFLKKQNADRTHFVLEILQNSEEEEEQRVAIITDGNDT
ncbi:hypothetical protein NKDENANG_00930 [Candidatus Entotheonellaceae bacterium PAL068K]